MLHSRSHKSTRLTCLLVGPHMRVRLTSATVHTPALEVSISERTTVRSALTCVLLRSLSSERRLLSHHGPGIALPPTCVRKNACLALGKDHGHAAPGVHRGPHAMDDESRTRFKLWCWRYRPGGS